MFVCLFRGLISVGNDLTQGNTLIESKQYSSASLEDSFADDKLIVVLTNEESLKFSNYSKEDFPEINCADICDISSATSALVRSKLEGAEATDNSKGERSLCKFANSQRVDVSTFNRILCITLSSTGKENVLKSVHALEKRRDILYVGPDYEASMLSAVPNDNYYCEQEDISELISLPQAWGVVTSGTTVRVGVIDTGIDQTHPDLENQVNTSLSYNFTNMTGPDANPCIDHNGHGTHVAGIIAAQVNNGMGIAGVCSTVELISLKVAMSDGGTEYTDIIEAIDYAQAMDIPILNISIGGTTEAVGLEEAIENYYGLVVCAAGNNGNLNNDIYDHFPSNYRLDNLIAVGASYCIMGVEGRCDFSHYGKTTVDIFAPGEEILSCYPTHLCQSGLCEVTNPGEHIADGYHKLSGTSMATPYVTGVAALILSQYPDLSAQEIRNRIMLYGDPVQAVSNYCVSGCRINAYLAVHGHRYTYNATISTGVHDCVCSICGYTTSETHDWETVAISKPMYRCRKCGFITRSISGLSLPGDNSMELIG